MKDNLNSPCRRCRHRRVCIAAAAAAAASLPSPPWLRRCGHRVAAVSASLQSPPPPPPWLRCRGVNVVLVQVVRGPWQLCIDGEKKK
jgi:hypothetical protein